MALTRLEINIYGIQIKLVSNVLPISFIISASNISIFGKIEDTKIASNSINIRWKTKIHIYSFGKKDFFVKNAKNGANRTPMTLLFGHL